MNFHIEISAYIFVACLVYTVLCGLLFQYRPQVFLTARFGDDSYRALLIPQGKQREIFIWAALTTLFIALLVCCLVKSPRIADSEMYLVHWRNAHGIGSLDTEDRVEASFSLIASMTPTYKWLIAVYAIISLGVTLVAVRYYSSCIWVSMWVYIAMFFTLHEMIQIRAGVTCALMLVMVKFLYDRNWKAYFALALVAFFFHKSAAVFFPIYFLSPRKSFNWLYIAAIIVSLILYYYEIQFGQFLSYLNLDFVQEYYNSYGRTTIYKSTGIGPLVYTQIFFGIVMLLRINTMQENYPYAIITVKIFVIAVLCRILLSDIPAVGMRLSEQLGAIEVLTLAALPMVMPRTRWPWIILVMLYAAPRIPSSLLQIQALVF